MATGNLKWDEPQMAQPQMATMNLKWFQPQMAQPQMALNLRCPQPQMAIENLRWAEPQVAPTSNSPTSNGQPQMGPTSNGTNLKWPTSNGTNLKWPKQTSNGFDLKWPTSNGKTSKSQPQMGVNLSKLPLVFQNPHVFKLCMWHHCDCYNSVLIPQRVGID